MAQWVIGLVLSLQQLQWLLLHSFSLWPRNFHRLCQKKKKKYCLKIPVDLLSLSVKWGLAFIIYKMGMMTTMPQRGWGASLFPSSDWKQRP